MVMRWRRRDAIDRWPHVIVMVSGGWGMEVPSGEDTGETLSWWDVKYGSTGHAECAVLWYLEGRIKVRENGRSAGLQVTDEVCT